MDRIETSAAVTLLRLDATVATKIDFAEAEAFNIDALTPTTWPLAVIDRYAEES